MKMYYNLFSLIPICFFLTTGCIKSSLEDKLVGAWSVDINSVTIERNNWHNIYGNTFTLKKDFSCEVLPFKDHVTDKFYPSHGIWNTISHKGQDSLVLSVQNNPMNGKYKIEFYRDFNKKLLKIKLSNESVEFTCSKFIQNFDSVEDW